MQLRTSSLTQIKIVVIEAEQGDQGPYIDLLNKRGHGFAMRGLDQPTIILDGRIRSEPWFTPDHMTAVEAHEICHLLLGSVDEDETDRAAVMMLKFLGHDRAAALLQERAERESALKEKRMSRLPARRKRRSPG